MNYWYKFFILNSWEREREKKNVLNCRFTERVCWRCGKHDTQLVVVAVRQQGQQLAAGADAHSATAQGLPGECHPFWAGLQLSWLSIRPSMLLTQVWLLGTARLWKSRGLAFVCILNIPSIGSHTIVRTQENITHTKTTHENTAHTKATRENAAHTKITHKCSTH